MINLLPYSQKSALRRVLKLRVANATLVFLLFLIAVGVLLIVPSFVSVNLRYRLAKQTYSALAESGSFANDEEIAATTAAIEVLKKAYDVNGTFSVLAALDSLVIPPGVTVSNISMASMKSRVIELTGISRDRATLQRFIASVEAYPAVASVDNPVSNFVKNQNGQFKIMVHFK